MPRAQSVFGLGVYDLLEASHLLGIDERTLRRWSQPGKANVPPLTFSYFDPIKERYVTLESKAVPLVVEGSVSTPAAVANAPTASPSPWETGDD